MNIKALMPKIAEAETENMTNNIAKKVMDVLNKDLNKKYHEEFDKIVEEFKRMGTYINSIEQKVDVKLESIEKRLTQLENRKDKAN